MKRRLFQSLTAQTDIIDARLVAQLAGLEGVAIAVVTSSNQAEVEPILRQAGLLGVLRAVVYGNEVKRYKPHPEPYLIALERLGVSPCDAVVFEDSESGIRSGRDAGCRVVEVEGPKDLPGLIEATLSGSFNF